MKLSLQRVWAAQGVFLTRLHLWLPPTLWVSDGVGGPWVSRGRGRAHAVSPMCVFTGPGALHVLPEQRLQEDHLPQLAAWLQRGADHVLLAGGTERCGVGETGPFGSRGAAIFIY